MGIIKKIQKRKNRTPEELAEIEFKRIKLQKGEIGIDCGANVGNYTSHLAKKGATVYAFEPNPYAFGALSYRFRKRKNVVCINKGVMDNDGIMNFYLRNDSNDDPVYWSTGSYFMTKSKNLNYNSNLEVEVVDLSKFILSLNSGVKILKMDIEGAEYAVLIKLINSGVISKIDHVFVETHEKYNSGWVPESEKLLQLIKSKEIKNINLDWK